MRKVLSFVAILIATIFLAFVVHAQNRNQETLSAYWKIVPLAEFENKPKNWTDADPKPVVSGLLYDEMAGPEGGVYALIVTASCTGTKESDYGTYCTGYTWSTEVAPFPFDR
ncbi:MAG: hypothetical protein OXG25_07645 [Gammaproteobacteria bacterium]|nr:hypothetical protein [Gammaproteobacteria bacterium]